MARKIVVAVLLYVIPFSQFVYGEECLNYEPAKVTLEGTLTMKILPGPPEYESIEKGDRPERYWLLKLTKPVCVNEHDEEIDFEDSRDVRRMHLVVNPEDYSRYESFITKKVVVTGILVHKYVGYDHTRVLEAISIRLARGKAGK